MAEWLALENAVGVEREVIVASTGWPIQFERSCGETRPPTATELELVGDLKARTAAAHGLHGEAA